MVTTNHPGPTVPQGGTTENKDTKDREAGEGNEGPVQGPDPGPELEETHAPNQGPVHHIAEGGIAEADIKKGPQEGTGETALTTRISSVNSLEV